MVVLNTERTGRVDYKKLPWGIWLLERLGICNYGRALTRYKLLIFVWTFCIYTSYHLSRKPFSVVKVTLCPVCANCSLTWNGTGYLSAKDLEQLDQDQIPGWPPFNDRHNGRTFLGSVDYSWLFAYAIFIFFNGYLADRVNLRYFLSIGMIGSGITVCLLGVAYFADIHQLAYFVIIQIFGGALQSTGWPGVVAIMSKWFGKHNRGLIMGIWNSHTSVGNILGTVLPSFWAGCQGSGDTWGWSFFIPGVIIIFFGIITFFILVTDPAHVGLPPPTHHTKEELEVLGVIKKKKKVTASYDVTRARNDESDTDTQPHDTNYTRNGRGLWKRLTGVAVTKEKEDLPDDMVDHDHAVLIRSVEKREIKSEEEDELEKEEERKENIESCTEAKEERENKEKAVTFFQALAIPGVVEFALSLFFDKLVSYTFLYWLPLYVKYTRHELSGPESDWLATLFDVGGIIGGITAGLISDKLNARAIICVIFLVLAVPFLLILRSFGDGALWVYIVLLIFNGIFINGPYSIITTAVSSDLGTHLSLKSNQNAKAIVTAIIDGTGSLGAAIGPLVVGIISDHSSWTMVFYFLMVCCLLSALLLSRLVYKEVVFLYYRCSCNRLHDYDRDGEEHELRSLDPLSVDDSTASNSEAGFSDSEH